MHLGTWIGNINSLNAVGPDHPILSKHSWANIIRNTSKDKDSHISMFSATIFTMTEHLKHLKCQMIVGC